MQNKERNEQEMPQAGIITCMESGRFKPYLRLIAAVVVFCFTWLQVHPSIAQQSVTPEVKPSTDTTYVDQKDLPRSDYEPVRQTFEKIQMLQGKELEAYKRTAVAQNNFEASYYRYIGNLFNTLGMSQRMAASTTEGFKRLREISINTTVQNLSNVFPLHYFYKDGDYTEYVNGLPYRSTRKVPDGEGAMLHEVTYYKHNADRLLIRTTSNYYDTEGGKLLSTITRDITPETGSVWYALNSGKKQTNAYNLVKSIHQILENLKEGYTLTTDTNYINDKQAHRAATWTEITQDSRFPDNRIEVKYTNPTYNEENQMTGVKKDYTETATDPNTGALVISKQWTEFWSDMQYVADGQLMAGYKVKKQELDENGQIVTTYMARQNRWDENSGRLLNYNETFTDPFGVITQTNTSGIKYNNDGMTSYNQTIRRYRKDENGNLVIDETRTVKRTDCQYKDGKLVAYTEEIIDENGIPHTYKYSGLVYDRGKLAGYNLIETIDTPTADGEYRKETKQTQYSAKYDQYGRIMDEGTIVNTTKGRPEDGEIINTTQNQNVHYDQYYLTGRPKAYTILRSDSTAPNKIITEEYKNIKYEKGQIKSYTLIATSSDAPDKKEINDVVINYDKYGRPEKTTEIIREIGKGIDVTTTRVTVVTKWDKKGRRLEIERSTVKSSSTNRTDVENIHLTYDAAGDVDVQDVTTHATGTDAKGKVLDATERAITTYKHDSAGRVISWLVKTIDQFGNIRIDENDATPVDLTKLDQLGLALEEQNVTRTPTGEIIETKINGYNSLGQLTHFRKTTNEYDMDGNLISTSVQTATVKYDEFGRAVETKTGSLKEGKITWLTEKVDAFNRLGQMVRMTRTSLTDDGQVKIENFSYTYDTFGRTFKVLDNWNGAQGPGYLEETYYYNSIGLVDHKDIASQNPLQPVIQGTSYEQGRVFYKYNIYGQVLTETASGVANTPYGNNLGFTSSTQYSYDLKGRLIENHLARSDGAIRTTIDSYFTYKNGKPSDVHTIKNVSTQGTTDTLGHFEYNNRGELTSSIQTEKRGGYTTVDTAEITYDQNHLISGTTQAQTKTDAAGNYYANQSVYQVLTRDAKLKIGKYSNATLVYGKLGGYILNPNKFWIRETLDTKQRDALGRPTVIGIDRIDESKTEGHGRTSQITRSLQYNELGNVISEREIENTTSGGKNITRDTQTSNITYVFVPGLGYLRNSWSTVVTTKDRDNPTQTSAEQFQRFYTNYYPAGHVWAGLPSGYKENSFDKVKNKWNDAEDTINVCYNMLNQLVSAKSGKYQINYAYRTDGKQDYQAYSGDGAHGKITYIYNQYGELTRTIDEGSARVHEKKTTRELSEEGKERKSDVEQDDDLTSQERRDRIREIEEDYMVVSTVEYEAVSSWTTVTDYNYLNNGVKNDALSHSSSRTLWVKQDGNTYIYHYKGDRIDYIEYTLGATGPHKYDGYKIRSGSGRITYVYEGNKLVGKVDNGTAEIKAKNGVRGTQTWSTYSDYKGNDKWEKNEDLSSDKTRMHEGFWRKVFRIVVDAVLTTVAAIAMCFGPIGWAVALVVVCLKAWFDAYMATGESSFGSKNYRNAYWKACWTSVIAAIASWYFGDYSGIGSGLWSAAQAVCWNLTVNVCASVASEYASEYVANYGQDHGWSKGEIAFWSTVAGVLAGAAVGGGFGYLYTGFSWANMLLRLALGLFSATLNDYVATQEDRLLDKKKKELDEKYGKDEDIGGTKAADKKRQEYNRYASRIDFNYSIASSIVSELVTRYAGQYLGQFFRWLTGDIKQTPDGKYWGYYEEKVGFLKKPSTEDGAFICFGSFLDMLNGKAYSGELTEDAFRAGLEACGMSPEDIGELTKGMMSDSDLEGARIGSIKINARGEVTISVKGYEVISDRMKGLGDEFGNAYEERVKTEIEYRVKFKRNESGEIVAEYEKTGKVSYEVKQEDLSQNAQDDIAKENKKGNIYAGKVTYDFGSDKLTVQFKPTTLAAVMSANITEDSKNPAKECEVFTNPKEFQNIVMERDLRAINRKQTPEAEISWDVKLGSKMPLPGWMCRLFGISKFGNIKADDVVGRRINDAASKLELGADDILHFKSDADGNISIQSLTLSAEILAKYARGRMEAFMKYNPVISKKFDGGEYDYELVYNSNNTAPDRIRFTNKENGQLSTISKMQGTTYWLIMEGGKPVTDIGRYNNQTLAMYEYNVEGNRYVRYYDKVGNYLAIEEFVIQNGNVIGSKFLVPKMINGTMVYVQLKRSSEIWKIKGNYFLKAIWIDHVKQVLYGPNLEEIAPSENVSIDKLIASIPDEKTRDIVRDKAADIKQIRGFVLPNGKVIDPSFRGPFSAVKEMQKYGLIDKSIILPNVKDNTVFVFRSTPLGIQISGPNFNTIASYRNLGNMGLLNRGVPNTTGLIQNNIPASRNPQKIGPTIQQKQVP